MAAVFNISDSFRAYSFYDASATPLIVGLVLAVIFAMCIFGVSKQISKITGILVFLMEIFYILVSPVIIATHLNLIPEMFADIFFRPLISRQFSGNLQVLLLCRELREVFFPTRPA